MKKLLNQKSMSTYLHFMQIQEFMYKNLTSEVTFFRVVLNLMSRWVFSTLCLVEHLSLESSMSCGVSSTHCPLAVSRASSWVLTTRQDFLYRNLIKQCCLLDKNTQSATLALNGTIATNEVDYNEEHMNTYVTWFWKTDHVHTFLDFNKYRFEILKVV